ncbi:hypothetical protein [Micrococcus luteus]|uniref:hypothetical protein n=1 Tax=Micrococcus luteus TaxID=1270 RepID=UPI0006686645|nr:hypothetical protein [Micrococcus luteus]MBN6749460.1 hypothetical protein [Micrococcus luteus]MBN6759458.1 hypothetical protein [Micrococcus luteus]MBN6800821.1 hypothetical protein [Micrococcus luteus]TKD53493.1 hypothetical protein FBF74_10890 [Micrococcus luteus]
MDPTTMVANALTRALNSILDTRQARLMAMQGPWWQIRTQIRTIILERQATGDDTAGWAKPALADLFGELSRAADAPEIRVAGNAWTGVYDRLAKALEEERRSGAALTMGPTPLENGLDGLLGVLNTDAGLYVWKAKTFRDELNKVTDKMVRAEHSAMRNAENARRNRPAGSAGGIAAWDHPAHKR